MLHHRSSRFLASLVLAGLVACGTGSTPVDPGFPPPPAPPPPAPPPAPPTALGPAVPVPLTHVELRDGAFSGILHCAGPLSDTTEYAGYLAGFPDTPPAMHVLYYSLKDTRSTPAERLQRLAENLNRWPGIPFLGISYTVTTPAGVQGFDAEVAAGEFDTELTAIAQILAADPRPIMVRPGFEFNGSWNGYSPLSYRDSFRHIRDLFLATGAQQTTWIWNYHPGGTVAPYPEFYPGDEYVDWWGVNLFGNVWSGKKWANVTAFVADARSRGKPVIIPESVPIQTFDMQNLATWQGWFAPYFSLINADMKGFCYSNRNYTKIPAWQDWGDLRIEESVLASMWAMELSNPQYVHLK